jgi:NADH:ubiquinone oxidoreductase subunit 6 (subunit J)
MNALPLLAATTPAPFPASDWLVATIFIVFVAMTVIGGVIAVFTRRIIRSVCGLAICCTGLGALFYFLGSPFLGLMEILIYVGAVCITIIFGVMLAEPDMPGPLAHIRPYPLIGLAVGLGVFIGIAALSLSGDWKAPDALVNSGSVKDIGIALLTTYSVPFELISLVLLVAILGALVIARMGRSKE